MSSLIVKDGQGNWMLKGVPWKSLHEGQIITQDMSRRLYGALYKLMDYEDTGYSPENIEHIRYVLEDAVRELEKCHGQSAITEEIWNYLNKY